MRVLLDTNAVTALLRGDEQVARALRSATEVLLSTIVLGELVHGFRGGRRFEKNLAVLRRLVAQPFVEVRDVTFETAEVYGRIQSERQAAGGPIPTNDAWIAAHAIESGAELWSYDRHFAGIGTLAWRHLV